MYTTSASAEERDSILRDFKLGRLDVGALFQLLGSALSHDDYSSADDIRSCEARYGLPR